METKQLTEEEYFNKIKEKLDRNHMWLNAFRCINPTDKLKIEIGEWILDLSNDKESLLPSIFITENNETLRELAVLNPMLYIRINKS